MAVLAMRDALNQALREEMKRDEAVFLLGEDIGLYDGSFKVTRGLMKEFGEKRVLDTPIAEEIIIGTAIGAAMSGLRPVAEMMTVNFIMVAMDQVVNAAAHIRYMFGGGTKVPLVIRTPGGGGHQLGAQHSHSHENWFAHVPGLKVVAPGTPADAKGMLKSAIRDDNPVMFIENEGTYAVKGEVPDGEHLVPLDKNEVKRPGEHITICAHSRMLIVAMDAAIELEKEGISAEVVDMRALRPLDMAPVIASVKKTSRLITVEEGWRSYGVGSEIAARVYEEAFDYLDAPVARIAAAEVPAPYNKRLEKIAFPGKADVIVTARALLGKN
jgi:pyruvate dehydrogenase E1 component beta subunit